jgi:uncharacterized protein (DUF488 family)
MQLKDNNCCNLFTIGFTKKNAKEFFGLIKKNGINLLVDVRLNNQSQLAGFTKRNDLMYFLETICSCSYIHKLLWAPNEQILKDYKKKIITWADYDKKYISLLDSRNIAQDFNPEIYNNSCLLCSEPEPSQCHRRLLAEFFQKKNPNIVIKHL